MTAPRAGTAAGGDVVHVIDRDDGSLCALVRADQLVPREEAAWSTVPVRQRCVACSFLMTSPQFDQF